MPTTPLHIRQVAEEELPIIQKLAWEIWPFTYASILSPTQLQYMLDLFYSDDALQKDYHKKGYIFFIINYNHKDVGYAGMEIKYPTSHLHKIYLLPDFQGRGLGKKLIRFVQMTAKQAGSQQLTLNVNRYNPAIQFYESCGFRIKSEVDIAIGNGYFMNDYIMYKKI